ncbi:hypothetical protein HYV49_02700 [Candidatus Pacearchaeota archaeon]|nr:hypothetical protein [Candidatus Pacearchaeota archaeon]
MQLSKLEDIAYHKLRKNGLVVFRIKDLCLLLNIDRINAYNLIKALKRKNAIKKAGKSFFAFSDTNEFVIGVTLNHPSYISFWSALNYYGLNDQTPRKIFLATTKYSKEINNFIYVTLARKRFFGYTKIGEIVIADKEKAIIDSLLFPKYSGGIREIMTSIKTGLNILDISKLINYAIKVDSRIVIKRLGFILENFGYRKIKKLRKNIGKGYELLDPSLNRKNNFNKRWLLDVNG